MRPVRVVARRPDRHLADHCRFNNSFSPRSTGRSPSAPQILAAEPSAELRDRLTAELNELGSNDGAAMWAHRRLPERSKLGTADAQQVKDAFAVHLAALPTDDSEPPPAPRPAKQATGPRRLKPGTQGDSLHPVRKAAAPKLSTRACSPSRSRGGFATAITTDSLPNKRA